MEDRLDTQLRVYQRARAIAGIVKEEQCEAILACSGDLIDMPAGHLAARWLKVPYYAYMFDDYLNHWVKPYQKHYAHRKGLLLMKDAARVIVPNEFLCAQYRELYGVDAHVIHNPIESPTTWPEPQTERCPINKEVAILYTGAIYDAHYDAFTNLIHALGDTGDMPVKLHLYTNSSPEILRQLGIWGPVVLHGQVTAAAAVRLQQTADLLFLPLAFRSSIPEVVKTSAPGKLGEFLASGRPILVHAPADSFLSWYFRRHQCGMVVDQPEPRLLREAIKQLVQDAALRRRLASKAVERARIDFTETEAQARLLQLLSCGSQK